MSTRGAVLSNSTQAAAKWPMWLSIAGCLTIGAVGVGFGIADSHRSDAIEHVMGCAVFHGFSASREQVAKLIDQLHESGVSCETSGSAVAILNGCAK